MKLHIRKLVWQYGQEPDLLPYLVCDASGKKIRAFQARMEAEDFITMMGLKNETC